MDHAHDNAMRGVESLRGIEWTFSLPVKQQVSLRTMLKGVRIGNDVTFFSRASPGTRPIYRKLLSSLRGQIKITRAMTDPRSNEEDEQEGSAVCRGESPSRLSKNLTLRESSSPFPETRETPAQLLIHAEAEPIQARISGLLVAL
jgi:hypothetical protein